MAWGNREDKPPFDIYGAQLGCTVKAIFFQSIWMDAPIWIPKSQIVDQYTVYTLDQEPVLVIWAKEWIATKGGWQ
jgi:hypothetical protein